MEFIHDQVFETAKNFSNKPAISIGRESLSYSELNNAAIDLAKKINQLGFLNAPIGILAERKIETYINILGVLYAGCHYVPIGINSNFKKQEFTISISKTNLVLGSKIALSDLIKSLNITSSEKWKLDKPFQNFNIAIKKNLGFNQNKTINSFPIKTKITALAYILFTSGSTGIPKAVPISHKNISSFFHSFFNNVTFSPGAKVSQFYDLTFDPSVLDIFGSWINGCELCVVPEDEVFDPSAFIKREKIQIWNSVPTIAVFMSKMKRLKNNEFPELKLSFFSGEPFPKTLADEWKNAAPNSSLANIYGPTETTIVVTQFNYDKEQNIGNFKNGVLPIGKPYKNVKIQIIDEHKNILPTGVVGEIVIGGNQVSSGYLNSTEKTAFSFLKFPWDKDGEFWYRTGDLGFFNDQGNIECLGRLDSQIKIGGKRIEIGEIESVLRSIPILSTTVVVALKDKNLQPTKLVGFVLEEFTQSQMSAAIKLARDSLDPIFIPTMFFHIERFPTLDNGKINKKELEKIAYT